MTNFLWWVVRWPYWVTFNQNSDFLFPKSITPLLNTIVNLKMLKGGGTSDESVYLFTRVTIIASLKRLHHWNGFGGQNVVGAFPRAFFFFFFLSFLGRGGRCGYGWFMLSLWPSPYAYPFLWNRRHGSGPLPLHRIPSFPFSTFIHCHFNHFCSFWDGSYSNQMITS